MLLHKYLDSSLYSIKYIINFAYTTLQPKLLSFNIIYLLSPIYQQTTILPYIYCAVSTALYVCIYCLYVYLLYCTLCFTVCFFTVRFTVCVCYSGYEGAACERSQCPGAALTSWDCRLLYIVVEVVVVYSSSSRRRRRSR